MFSMSGYRFMVGDKELDLIMNASGAHCKTKEQMDQLITNGLNTIITKTCTLEKNSGNPLPNFQEINENNSINCLGMPNYGYKYYRDLYLEYVIQKKLTYIISLDASNWEELRDMLLDYDKFIMKNNNNNSRELVEINVSCPNKLDRINGKISRIIAYDPIELSRLLENIKLLDLNYLNIGLKLSPYIDSYLLQQISDILITYSNLVKYIVCGNSIPNGMILDITTSKPLLSIGTGGISGTANRLIGVSNVYQFQNIFKNAKKTCNIKIIGCGGIETSDDVMQYIIAGAKGVQIGRILYIDGVARVSNIWNHYQSKL